MDGRNVMDMVTTTTTMVLLQEDLSEAITQEIWEFAEQIRQGLITITLNQLDSTINFPDIHHAVDTLETITAPHLNRTSHDRAMEHRGHITSPSQVMGEHLIFSYILIFLSVFLYNMFYRLELDFQANLTFHFSLKHNYCLSSPPKAYGPPKYHKPKPTYGPPKATYGWVL